MYFIDPPLYRNDHTTMTAPLLVCPEKLNIAGPGLYYGGRRSFFLFATIGNLSYYYIMLSTTVPLCIAYRPGWRSLLTQYLDVVFFESPDGVGGPYCTFVLVLVLCFGNGTTETPAEFPMDAEIAAEGVVPADLDLLAIGLPGIGVLVFGCASKLEFRYGCWILSRLSYLRKLLTSVTESLADGLRRREDNPNNRLRCSRQGSSL